MRRQAYRRKVIRTGLITANVLLLGLILAFVLQKPSTGTVTQSASAVGDETSEVANPLDQVSSADIALTVARLNSLPETTAVYSQAQSQAAEVSLASTSHNVVSKPQVVGTSLKSSADIKDYIAVAGDTVTGLANKFGVTSDSIRWSNGLTGEAIAAGTPLRIPPVNGIVYTVNAGDTPESLAAKFHASKDKIIAYNDAEIKGLVVGQRIIIPDAIKTASVASARPSSTSGAFAWGIKPIYGSNGYDYGWCTWYVASRIAVPNNWGNANTWDNFAPSSGWTVSKMPRVGAIAQSNRGWAGHVGVVEAVSADGTMIKYSDMNGLAGWGRVGTTADWVPATRYDNYIYR